MRYVLALLSVAVLTGCSLSPTIAPTPQIGAAFGGRVQGGQQPVVGSHVYLYAANTTGYGGNGITASSLNASISLLTANVLINNPLNSGLDSNGYYVTTASNGSFSIQGDYACTAGQQVYIYALGGNPGAGTNSAAGFLAAVGDCSTITTSTFVWLNEVSTIAAAYAMAGFATDATHVSSSGSALAKTGIANAFLNAANLADLSTGVALTTTPAGNGTVPQTKINTLANILASCVNSSGPTTSTCVTLFTNAMSNGSTGTVATDAATAAINIAHNPGSNVTALYTIPPPTIAFSPTLTPQPNDFTIGLNFTGGGVSFVKGLAIDGSGNAWTANYNTNTGISSVSKLSSLGAAISSSGGFTGGGITAPYAIAIDGAGGAWTANYVNSGTATGQVSQFSSTGTAVSGTGYTGGGLSYAYAIAIDGNGLIWVADYLGAVSTLSAAGAPLSGSSGYSVGQNVECIAMDGAGNAWTASNYYSYVYVLSRSGTSVNAFNGGGISSPRAIALDSNGSAWTANNGNNTVSKYSNSGTVLSGSAGFAVHNTPVAIAIDGAGNAWTANPINNNISEFTNAGAAVTGATGYAGGSMNGPNGIAPDGSGNIWVSNAASSVTEFIGLSVPVITPIRAGLPITPTVDGSSNLGTRP